MSSHYDQAISAEADLFWRQLARRCAYSPRAAAQLLCISLRQLERNCDWDLHRCPREFFQAQRMAHAAERLAHGEPAKCVALELGYTQISNFSRDFKRHFGQCPTIHAPRLAAVTLAKAAFATAALVNHDAI